MVNKQKLKKMNKEELLESDLRQYCETYNIARRTITIKTSSTKAASPIVKEIICELCKQIIATAIWDGIKWVWEYLTHNDCPPKPDPIPDPIPECCQICGAQLIPGKKHECE